ncbi:hypothetical protein B0H13DRAFT_1612399 [Mycena leptocephala]|nr:hypothetical protein B0H13DRAFT_1612399 [Mycena leptocephala]
MDTGTALPRRLPNVQFRVLVAGRANAGKTSILQRVCETTESPEIYKVCDTSHGMRFLTCFAQRGQHNISDELVFTNHTGYVFHDSRGFESGSTNEMELIEAFVRDRSQRRKLQERLHAIWSGYLSTRFRYLTTLIFFGVFHSVCEVPVIAVFTKYEAFKRNVRMDLEDEAAGELDDIERRTHDECQERFKSQFWELLGTSGKFVRLEGMNNPDRRCDKLVRTTMDALNPDAVALMLVAVQKGNLELSVRRVVDR